MTAPTGAYVHVPFCTKRCDYCAFATWTDRSHLMDDYVDAVASEIDAAVAAGMEPVDTIFVGGGTPTLLSSTALTSLIGRIPQSVDAEITVEANPDTVTAESLQILRDGGVTRMSFGVQSMVPHVLASLGRTHHPENVSKAVEWARAAGFDTFNVDVIMGAVGETMADCEATLRAVIDLDTPHVSAYSLTVEAGTPLATDADRHPDDDDQAEKYLLTDRMLSAAGLDWYEVSNWARPGHECRHNNVYWASGDYRGFGCAAHSHRAGRRWWNLRTPERFIAAVAAGETTEAAGETLDAQTRELESLQLALRTRAGVPVRALDLDDPAVVGLVDVVGDRVVLTPEGRLLANEVAVRLRTESEVDLPRRR